MASRILYALCSSRDGLIPREGTSDCRVDGAVSLRNTLANLGRLGERPVLADVRSIVARAQNRIATPSQHRSIADPPWRHIDGWSQIRSQTGVERFAKTCCELQRCAFRARRSTKVSCVLLFWVVFGCPKLSHSIEALKSGLEELERSVSLTEEDCQPASRGPVLNGHSQVGSAALFPGDATVKPVGPPR